MPLSSLFLWCQQEGRERRIQPGIMLVNYLFFCLQEKWDCHTLKRKELYYQIPIPTEFYRKKQVLGSDTERCTKGTEPGQLWSLEKPSTLKRLWDSPDRAKNEITLGQVKTSRMFMNVWLQERSSPDCRHYFVCVCFLNFMKQNTPTSSFIILSNSFKVKALVWSLRSSILFYLLLG